MGSLNKLLRQASLSEDPEAFRLLCRELNRRGFDKAEDPYSYDSVWERIREDGRRYLCFLARDPNGVVKDPSGTGKEEFYVFGSDPHNKGYEVQHLLRAGIFGPEGFSGVTPGGIVVCNRDEYYYDLGPQQILDRGWEIKRITEETRLDQICKFCLQKYTTFYKKLDAGEPVFPEFQPEYLVSCALQVNPMR